MMDFFVRELKKEEKYVKLKTLSQFKVFIPETFTHQVLKHVRLIAHPSYSGLPNESTALMRVLTCKKSEIAKSTAFQNDPNKSTA